MSWTSEHVKQGRTLGAAELNKPASIRGTGSVAHAVPEADFICIRLVERRKKVVDLAEAVQVSALNHLD
jgi:hypothetical protein